MSKHKRNTSGLVPFTGANDPRRSNGRPKGSKNFATIIKELENEEFDWSLFPKENKELQQFIENMFPIGSPLRAIVYRALIDAITGTPAEKASAREWIRKAGYGDKLDVTSKGESIAPKIVSDIVPRDVRTQAETSTSNSSDQ